ncbi:MAG TPA: DUF1877 family protein [Myxococcales bacterium]|jgi:hypothetical protein|nr:DUF1877 family protein [Myxococcales bacterium]
MSINASFRELSASEEQELRRDPASIRALIGVPGPEIKEFLATIESRGGLAEAAREQPEYAKIFLRGLLLRMAPSREVFEKMLLAGTGLEMLLSQAEPLAPELAAEARKDPLALARFAFPPDAAEILRLQKAWHGVHWLVNGVAEGGEKPLDELITGGTPIGPKLAYGPATVLSAAEVKVLSTALEALPAATLKARFNLDAAIRDGIYGVQQNGDVAWLAESYAQLQALYARAARNDSAVLRWLS